MGIVYSGKKAIKHEISDNEFVTNFDIGVTFVRANDKPLESKRLSLANDRDLYKVFDWGRHAILERGMNLSASILNHYFNPEKERSLEVPNEMIFKFYRNVIRFWDDEWILPEELLVEDCRTIYKDLYGEEM